MSFSRGLWDILMANRSDSLFVGGCTWKKAYTHTEKVFVYNSTVGLTNPRRVATAPFELVIRKGRGANSKVWLDSIYNYKSDSKNVLYLENPNKICYNLTLYVVNGQRVKFCFFYLKKNSISPCSVKKMVFFSKFFFFC